MEGRWAPGIGHILLANLSFEEILRGDGCIFTCVSASSVSLSWSHSRKAAAPYDSLPGGSNSLSLSLSIFLFVWLSLAPLLWCVPLGAWLEFVVGFLPLFFLYPSQRRVCVFSPGVGMKSGNLLVL